MRTVENNFFKTLLSYKKNASLKDSNRKT